jgi:hypothetical protein
MAVVARVELVITAADDAAVDEVYKALHPLIEGYPGRTIAIVETDRYLAVT